MQVKRIKVGVFMGGKSIEREVSFNSGRTVCDHLDTQKFEVIPVFQTNKGLLYILPWRFLPRGKISDFEHRLPYEAKQVSWEELKELVDFMYLAVHGRFMEDGALQGMLEILNIPYLGTKVFGSALTMDKIIQRDFLQMHNIDIPKAIVVLAHEINNFKTNKDKTLKRLKEENINFPCVVKPHKEGSSLGITVVYNENDLENALIKASNITEGKSQPVLIEERIQGMEFTCIVINDKNGEALPLSLTEIVKEANSDIFDYEQKYMPGRATKITPARCTKEQTKKIQEICIKVMNILEIKTIARIDGFLTKDNRIIIIDPNSLSGMTPSSFVFRQAAEIGWNHTQLINHLIETDLKEYNLNLPLSQKNNGKDMNNSKIRVAVLMGGNSNEKEVSLDSGRNIMYKLSPDKYQPLAVFLNNQMQMFAIHQQLLVRNSTKEIELALQPNMKIEWSDLPKIADFVFIGLHGGQGENGCIQGALEMLGLPYNGSGVFASALCMDKFKTTQFLKHKGFKVPEGFLIDKNDWQEKQEDIIKKITSKINAPFIIKPHDDGCSVMVQKAKDINDLKSCIENIFSKNKNYALVEECVTGMELTVGVLGNDFPIALPASQAVATKGILSIEEKFLPGQGENQTPAPISQDAHKLVKKVMEDVYKAIGCKGYARIDCFYQNAEQSSTGKDEVIIIEVNSLPGMTPATCIFHQAAEIDLKPMDFIDLIITLGLQEHHADYSMQKEDIIINQIMSKLNLEKSTII